MSDPQAILRNRVPRTAADESPAFRHATRPARFVVTATVLAGIVLAALPQPTRTAALQLPSAAVALVFVLSSLINVELGRYFEGRLVLGQRPHKTLSVWTFATAVTAPTGWLLIVVPVTYLHTYWRGLRPPLWKWIGSASFVLLGGVAAHWTARGVRGDAHPMGGREVVALLAAIGAFLAVESALFYLISRINHASQEQWLRATLAGPSFYVTEAAVLAIGALSVVVWSASPWYGFLLLPAYTLVQQAALFDPLRAEARHDDKTGLLRFEPWRASSVVATETMSRAGRPWAVIMLDLDHFKAFNERHGHLAADETLVQVARTVEKTLRADDLVCRFGGEEFAILLCDADRGTAYAVAERLRARIARDCRPQITASLGIAAVSRGGTESLRGANLQQAISAADRALYDAKNAGRDRLVVQSLEAA
jgi:diguanylate cyclase (GGDEF)-like protein